MNSVIWKPQAKQAMAMSCPATELFYGGAAGGGKSDFLLGDFLQQAAKYGKRCHGILFRQSYSELEELIARSREIYEPIKAIFKITNKQWYFPNGATLKMRYVESSKDLRRYQGHQYTWVGFDELGNFPTDDCWTFLISRLRSPTGVPCYIRGTANPGGVGHSWIKNRFMDGHEPNKIFIVEKSEGKKTTKTSRVFIPSRLEDNKILMANDPNLTCIAKLSLLRYQSPSLPLAFLPRFASNLLSYRLHYSPASLQSHSLPLALLPCFAPILLVISCISPLLRYKSHSLTLAFLPRFAPTLLVITCFSPLFRSQLSSHS